MDSEMFESCLSIHPFLCLKPSAQHLALTSQLSILAMDALNDNIMILPHYYVNFAMMLALLVMAQILQTVSNVKSDMVGQEESVLNAIPLAKAAMGQLPLIVMLVPQEKLYLFLMMELYILLQFVQLPAIASLH